MTRSIPTPPGHFFWGHMRERRNDPIGLYTRGMTEYGPIVRFRMGFFSLILPTEPRYLEHVLYKNHDNYSKGAIFRKMEAIIGKGLITSEGEHWRRQRKLVQPVFDRQRWPTIVAMLHDVVAKRTEDWRLRRGKPFDLVHEMTELTMNVISISLFGERALPRMEELGRAGIEFVDEVSAEVIAHFHPLSFLRKSGPGPGTRNLRRIISELVAEMRKTSGGEDELVSLLLAARDEQGRPMSDDALLDEVLLLITAGFETTAMALSWTLFLVAGDARVQGALRQEIRDKLGSRAPNYEDLAELPYVKMVVEESLRLYPPAWSFPRQAIADDEIDGYPIPKGSIVACCSYVMHRHPQYWDRPDEFIPERWAQKGEKKRPRLTYFPFGAGMRQCSGNRLAMVEMPIILAQLAQAFELHLVPGPAVAARALITLRPDRPIHVHVS